MKTPPPLPRLNLEERRSTAAGRYRNVTVGLQFARYLQVTVLPSGYRVTVRLPRYRQVAALPSGYRVTVRLQRYRQDTVCREVGGVFRTVFALPLRWCVTIKLAGCSEVRALPRGYRVPVRFGGVFVRSPRYRKVGRLP